MKSVGTFEHERICNRALASEESMDDKIAEFLYSNLDLPITDREASMLYLRMHVYACSAETLCEVVQRLVCDVTINKWK